MGCALHSSPKTSRLRLRSATNCSCSNHSDLSTTIEITRPGPAASTTSRGLPGSQAVAQRPGDPRAELAKPREAREGLHAAAGVRVGGIGCGRPGLRRMCLLLSAAHSRVRRRREVLGSRGASRSGQAPPRLRSKVASRCLALEGSGLRETIGGFVRRPGWGTISGTRCSVADRPGDPH
jgi:hypothetical protein